MNSSITQLAAIQGWERRVLGGELLYRGGRGGLLYRVGEGAPIQGAAIQGWGRVAAYSS